MNNTISLFTNTWLSILHNTPLNNMPLKNFIHIPFSNTSLDNSFQLQRNDTPLNNIPLEDSIYIPFSNTSLDNSFQLQRNEQVSQNTETLYKEKVFVTW